MALGDIGPWSALYYIPGVANGDMPNLPAYVETADKSRLAAFRALAAFMEASRRELIEADETRPGEAFKLREFGDPATYVDAISAAVLGSDPEISVAGADTPIPRRPDLPPAPEQVEAGELGEAEARLHSQMYTAALAAWENLAQGIVDEWIADLQRSPLLMARQRWLRDWGDAQHEDFIGKLVEGEAEFVVPLGNGLMMLGWDAQRKRPAVTMIEPDAYFPVASDDDLSGFPDKVHFAWLFTGKDEKGDEAEFVRRITYELLPVDPNDPAYEPIELGQPPKYLASNDVRSTAGPQGPEEWTHSCLYSNGVWKLDDFKDVYDIEQEGVTWALIPDPSGGEQPVDAFRVPIGLDFIPVVLYTHTPARVNGWGRSPITRVAQAFDQLARADTGEALSAGWAAEPLTVLMGLVPGTYEENEDGTVGVPLYPGRALAAGPGGGVDTVDMAEHLSKNAAYVEQMQDRISTLMSVPKGMMGRVEAADIASGITLVLLFTRFQQAIGQARMARLPKWSLALKMVQRIEIQNAETPFGTGDITVYHSSVTPGQYMPNDVLAAANVVKLLRDAKAVSQEGSLRIMEEAGLNLDDLAVELTRLREVDADTAMGLAEAVGPKWAARYLNLLGWKPDDLLAGQPQVDGFDGGPESANSDGSTSAQSTSSGSASDNSA